MRSSDSSISAAAAASAGVFDEDVFLVSPVFLLLVDPTIIFGGSRTGVVEKAAVSSTPIDQKEATARTRRPLRLTE